MKKALLLLSLLFVLSGSTSACEIRIPLRVPSTPLPARNSMADLTELDMRRLNGLGMMLVQWEEFTDMLSGPAPQQQELVVALVGFFDNKIDVEKMQQVKDINAARAFSHSLIEQIGSTQGDPIYAILQANYYGYRAFFNCPLSHFNEKRENTQPKEEECISYVDNVIQPMERIHIEQTLIDELQEIREALVGLPLAEQGTIMNQLHEWLFTAQFAIRGQPTPIPATATPFIAKPRADIDLTIMLPVGDAARGSELMKTQGCQGCHYNDSLGVGPSWISADGKTISMRAEESWQRADYTGKATNAQQYLLESIVDPLAYLVPEYGPVHPANYNETLSEQDKADLIVYLLTLK